MTRNDTDDARTDTKLTRRKFVAAAAGALTAGAAGCSGVTEQSFEAQPVVLPESGREELVLSETGQQSPTVTREGPSGNIEVSITNQAAVYQRGPARGTPTVLEKFTSSVNQTPGSGSAISAVASDLGIDDESLSPFASAPQVSGLADQVGLTIPAGARGGDSIAPEQTMALVPASAVGGGESRYFDFAPGSYTHDDASGAIMPYADFAPGAYTHSTPSRAYMRVGDFAPGSYTHSSPGEQRVFVPAIDTLMDRIGMDSLPESAERVEAGQRTEAENTVIAAPGSVIQDPNNPLVSPERAFDAGKMLPLGGTPYGLGVLATPDASIAGQAANPVVGMDTTRLLQRDAAKRVLALTGLTDADTVEWLAGPTAVGPDAGYLAERPNVTTTLVGTDTEVESFVGVVSGADRPWGVFLNVARVTADDHVIAVSGITRPVGTADGGMALVEGSGWGMAPSTDTEGDPVPASAMQFTAETVGRLQRVEG